MRRIYLLLLPILLLAFADIGAQTAVATYKFSGNTHDVSATANDAFSVGATYTQDRFGVANSAMHFDGATSRVFAPNNPSLNTPTTTVSFWVKPDAIATSNEDYLVSFGGWQERWKVSLPTHAKAIWTTNATSISDMDAGATNELVPGQWDHLVFVHDGTNDIIYLNGQVANTKAVAGNLNSTSRVLGFGYDPIDGGSFFEGDLDDIMIFDGAMNAAAVLALHEAQSVAPVFTPGLVASYRFDGNLRDDSDFANHAKGESIEYTTDQFGFGNRAVEFDGEKSKVTAPNSAHLNSPTTTVMFWVKANSLPVSNEVYIASFGGWQERWKISLPAHGKMVWTTHAATCCSDLDAGGTNELVPGEWVHAAFVHDGVDDKIYINGVEVASKPAPGDLASTTYPLGIGYNPIDVDHYFDGAIDQFAIYNVALTETDIAEIYAEESTTVLDPDPKVLDLGFCGNLKDSSQFANHGESYNAEFTYDRFGYANNAISVEGADEAYVHLDNSAAYNSDETTVSFWVNMDELPASNEVYLLSFGGWQERWKLSVPNHGKVVWTTHGSSCCSDLDSGSKPLIPGQWMHVAATHGATEDKIYINGELAGSKTHNGPLNDTQHPLGIGWNPIDKSNFMSGDLDEIQIYNEALTDQEIFDLYLEQSATPFFPGNIVADYPLNGNGQDVSPYCNHGDVHGPTAALDRHGRSNHAMNFDGNDGITADNSPQLNSPLASVSFWANPNSLPVSNEVYLLSFGGWQERWKISLPSHGKPVWTTHASTCCSDLDAGDAANALVVGEWKHYVMVHDGVKDYIYVNGVEANSKDAPGNLATTVHPLGIGYNPIDVDHYFDGRLDDVILFETALSASEVLALYNEQNADPNESDVTSPEQPTNLEGTVEFTTVTLTWTGSFDEESGLAGYNVYQNSSIIQTVEGTEAVISGLAPLTLYEFGVSAVDSAGNESGVTTIFVTTGLDETPDTEAPSTPSNLAVSTGSNSANFSWDASTDNTGVAGYVVSLDGTFVDSVGPGTTSVFIGGLNSDEFYTFEVYAFDFAGNNSPVADITASTTEPVETAEPGLVAHYKFNGDANDATPYANHGAIGGNPTFVPAAHPNGDGLAIVFDGDADSVLAPNAVQLISDYTTVAFWIRLDAIDLSVPEAYVIDFGHWDQRWKISLPNHKRIVWTTNSKNLQSDNFIVDMDAKDGNELIEGFWFHVVMIHDGTDNIIYMDGEEVNRVPATGTLNSTGRPLGMGSNPIEGGQYFSGALDDVKIYNKALTSAEVLKLYEDGFTSVRDLQNELTKYVDIIYPNPTNDQLSIKHGFGGNQDLVIRVFDQGGRQVDALKVNATQMGSGLIPMDVTKLHGGTYNLNFVLDGKVMGSIPFVKQ